MERTGLSRGRVNPIQCRLHQEDQSEEEEQGDRRLQAAGHTTGKPRKCVGESPLHCLAWGPVFLVPVVPSLLNLLDTK